MWPWGPSWSFQGSLSYSRQFLAPIHFKHEHRASPGPPTSWAREKLGPTLVGDLSLPLLLEPIASKDWKIPCLQKPIAAWLQPLTALERIWWCPGAHRSLLGWVGSWEMSHKSPCLRLMLKRKPWKRGAATWPLPNALNSERHQPAMGP